MLKIIPWHKQGLFINFAIKNLQKANEAIMFFKSRVTSYTITRNVLRKDYCVMLYAESLLVCFFYRSIH